MPEHASVSEILISLTGPILLPRFILRSIYASSFGNFGLSTSPQSCFLMALCEGTAQFSGLLRNLQHHPIERVLRLLPRSLFRQLLRLMLYQELAGGCPLLPLH